MAGNCSRSEVRRNEGALLSEEKDGSFSSPSWREEEQSWGRQSCRRDYYLHSYSTSSRKPVSSAPPSDSAHQQSPAPQVKLRSETKESASSPLFLILAFLLGFGYCLCCSLIYKAMGSARVDVAAVAAEDPCSNSSSGELAQLASGEPPVSQAS